MSRQITIRGVSDEAARRLRRFADARGVSVNSFILELVEKAVGTSDRREQLARYATWTATEADAFDEVLRGQRIVDESDWQ